MLDFNTVSEEVNSGGFVKSSGVHTVELIRVGSQDRKAPSKAKALSITVQGDSEYTDTLYNFNGVDIAPHYIKSNGEPSKLVARFIAPLATIVGTTDSSVEPQPVETKDGMKDMDTFVGLSGTGTIIRIAVQMQWDNYNKKMAPVVKAVFNEDGFSATEIKAGATEAKQIKLYENLQDGKAPEAVAGTTVDLEAEANDIF